MEWIFCQCCLTVFEFHNAVIVIMFHTCEVTSSCKTMVSGFIFLTVNMQDFIPCSSYHWKQCRITTCPVCRITLPHVFIVRILIRKAVNFRCVFINDDTCFIIFKNKLCHFISPSGTSHYNTYVTALPSFSEDFVIILHLFIGFTVFHNKRICCYISFSNGHGSISSLFTRNARFASFARGVSCRESE